MESPRASQTAPVLGIKITPDMSSALMGYYYGNDQWAAMLMTWNTPALHSRPALPHKQSGAVEACWAHNPEVDGSKPFSAIFFVFFCFAFP